MSYEKFLTQDREPRFRNPTIRDLLLITVAMAPFLSLYSWIAKEVFGSETSSALQSVFILIQSSLCGIFIAALFWFAESKKTDGRYFLHPGYWLIAIQGTYAMSQFLPFLAYTFSSGDGFDGGFYGLVFPLAIALSLISWVIILHGAIKNSGWWKFCFLLMLIPSGLVQLMFSRFLGLQQLLYAALIYQAIVGLIMLIPIAIDVAKPVGRDWIHWLGVGIALLMKLIVPLANYLLFLLT